MVAGQFPPLAMPRITKIDVDTHLGLRVKARREELGLTQAQLGEKLGISYQQVQKYERGRDRISAGRLYDIASLLEVGFEYFFAGLKDNQIFETRKRV